MNELHAYIAHRRESDGTPQSVKEHLQGVAELAAGFAGKLGLAKHGELIGLLHDLGKYSKAFQDYISEDETADGFGKVDHSTAGAQFVWQALAERGVPSAAAAQFLALCMASHHGGLIDSLTPEGEDRFGIRMQKADNAVHFQEVLGKADQGVLERSGQLLADPSLVRDLLAKMKSIAVREKALSELGSETRIQFMGGLLIRVLYSGLIDADRTDTADFERPWNKHQRARDKYPGWQELICRLERHLEGFEDRYPVDTFRRQVSEACLHASAREPGLFTLTVPTGGGKTLASLRFALHHAAKHRLDRVIYIVPYTTIIDQNAQVVREVLEPTGVKFCSVLLEHHSNLADDRETPQSRLLSENWDAPVVYTTMVQVLEALFGSGTRNVRRLHQMTRAVLVFDEIQTLPVRTVYIFCNALRFLVDHCGSSVVLCTATQPLLGEVDRSKGHLPLTPENEIVRDVDALFQNLNRVQVADLRKPCGWTEDEVAVLARNRTEGSGSCLVIVNTKKAAKALYQRLCECATGIPVYHLSTNMCPAHRLSVLSKIERRIGKAGKPATEPGPVICTSTQLIEAGVDVDFGSVIRYVAGLDSIAQAAGRCNRNQRRESGLVAIVNSANESLDQLEDIREGRDAAIRVLGEYSDSPESLGHNLLSPAAISRYFQYYFFDRRGLMDYPVSAERDDNLLNMLSKNVYAVAEYERRHNKCAPHYWRQSFGSAARAFEAIDARTHGVIIPFGEVGEGLIADLCSAPAEGLPRLLHKAQRYSVNVFPRVLEQLWKAKAVSEVQKGTGIVYLDEAYYSEEFGLSTEPVSGKRFLNA